MTLGRCPVSIFYSRCNPFRALLSPPSVPDLDNFSPEKKSNFQT